jgi:hypothetical protein
MRTAPAVPLKIDDQDHREQLIPRLSHGSLGSGQETEQNQ